MATLTRTRPSAPYLGLWALLSSVALVYMASVSLKPDLVAALVPPVKLAMLMLDEDDVELRKSAAETETMRRHLYAARAEAGGLRIELARRTDREAALSQQMAAIEAREARLAELEAAAAPTLAVAGKKAVVADLAAKAKATAQKSPIQPTAKAQLPAPQASPGMLAVERLANASPTDPVSRSSQSAAAPIETASLPPQTRAGEASGPAGIVLSTGPSVDSLRLNWAVLSQRHQDDLQRLQPRYTANKAPGGSGEAYDLVAGPLPNAAEAQRVCAALRAKFVSCKVGTYGGNTL